MGSGSGGGAGPTRFGSGSIQHRGWTIDGRQNQKQSSSSAAATAAAASIGRRRRSGTGVGMQKRKRPPTAAAAQHVDKDVEKEMNAEARLVGSHPILKDWVQLRSMPLDQEYRTTGNTNRDACQQQQQQPQQHLHLQQPQYYGFIVNYPGVRNRTRLITGPVIAQKALRMHHSLIKRQYGPDLVLAKATSKNVYLGGKARFTLETISKMSLEQACDQFINNSNSNDVLAPHDSSHGLNRTEILNRLPSLRQWIWLPDRTIWGKACEWGKRNHGRQEGDDSPNQDHSNANRLNAANHHRGEHIAKISDGTRVVTLPCHIFGQKFAMSVDGRMFKLNQPKALQRGKIACSMSERERNKFVKQYANLPVIKSYTRLTCSRNEIKAYVKNPKGEKGWKTLKVSWVESMLLWDDVGQQYLLSKVRDESMIGKTEIGPEPKSASSLSPFGLSSRTDKDDSDIPRSSLFSSRPVLKRWVRLDDSSLIGQLYGTSLVANGTVVQTGLSKSVSGLVMTDSFGNHYCLGTPMALQIVPLGFSKEMQDSVKYGVKIEKRHSEEQRITLMVPILDEWVYLPDHTYIGRVYGLYLYPDGTTVKTPAAVTLPIPFHHTNPIIETSKGDRFSLGCPVRSPLNNLPGDGPKHRIEEILAYFQPNKNTHTSLDPNDDPQKTEKGGGGGGGCQMLHEWVRTQDGSVMGRLDSGRVVKTKTVVSVDPVTSTISTKDGQMFALSGGWSMFGNNNNNNNNNNINIDDRFDAVDDDGSGNNSMRKNQQHAHRDALQFGNNNNNNYPSPRWPSHSTSQSLPPHNNNNNNDNDHSKSKNGEQAQAPYLYSLQQQQQQQQSFVNTNNDNINSNNHALPPSHQFTISSKSSSSFSTLSSTTALSSSVHTGQAVAGAAASHQGDQKYHDQSGEAFGSSVVGGSGAAASGGSAGSGGISDIVFGSSSVRSPYMDPEWYASKIQQQEQQLQQQRLVLGRMNHWHLMDEEDENNSNKQDHNHHNDHQHQYPTHQTYEQHHRPCRHTLVGLVYNDRMVKDGSLVRISNVTLLVDDQQKTTAQAPDGSRYRLETPAPPPCILDEWYAGDNSNRYRGKVYGRPGVANGTHITTSEVVLCDPVRDLILTTSAHRYILGIPRGSLPILTSWKPLKDGRYIGKLYGKPQVLNGTAVRTTRVVSLTDNIITTAKGQRYKLGSPQPGAGPPPYHLKQNNVHVHHHHQGDETMTPGSLNGTREDTVKNTKQSDVLIVKDGLHAHT